METGNKMSSEPGNDERLFLRKTEKAGKGVDWFLQNSGQLGEKPGGERATKFKLCHG